MGCGVLCCDKTRVFTDSPVGRWAGVFYGVIKHVCVCIYRLVGAL